jgi:hypothetical protein
VLNARRDLTSNHDIDARRPCIGLAARSQGFASISSAAEIKYVCSYYASKAHVEITVNRELKTESLKPEDMRAILDKQRLNRPSSPHMTIYEPQITWYASIFHRITGTGLSVGKYPQNQRTIQQILRNAP